MNLLILESSAYSSDDGGWRQNTQAATRATAPRLNNAVLAQA